MHPQYDGSGVMKHGYGVLFGTAANSSVTMVGNLMAHQVERNPLSRAAEFVFVNNVVYNRGTMDVDLQSQDGRIDQEFGGRQRVPAWPELRPRHRRPIFVRTSGSLSLVPGSRVYVHDNNAPESGSTYSQLVTLTGGDVIVGPDVADHCTGLEHRPRGAPDGEQRGLQPRAQVRRCASHRSRLGRPAHRAERASSRNGQIINCVVVQWHHALQQERRWLADAARRIVRTLTLPANHEHRSRRTATAISRTGCTRWT